MRFAAAVSRRRASLALAALGMVMSALAALMPRPVKAQAEIALAIIVSPTSKLTNIAFEDLRRAFQSQRLEHAEGGRLIALNHPPKTPDRVGFDQVVLNMDPSAVGRFWIERKLRRESGPPRTVASLGTLRRVVEKLPGAIGYIRPGQLGSQVRAIRVDGKLPEDAGYPVRYWP